MFAHSVRTVRPQGRCGDLAVVFDQHRKFSAIALYDPESAIPLRILHAGKPVTIDRTWWRTQIHRALQRREGVASNSTNAYRCVHGESDGLAGLIIDRYDQVAVIKIYAGGLVGWIDTIVELISELDWVTAVVVRWSRELEDRFGDVRTHVACGALDSPTVRFLENDVMFEADVMSGHKTGHFLDQRDNRLRVRKRARDARVLDVFSCTGGFTVNAAIGGARSVTAIDISAPALSALRHNLDLNRANQHLARCNVTTTCGDAFVELERLLAARVAFDLVILDPPSFANKKTALVRATQSYARLIDLAIKLTDRGGTLVAASCSSRMPAEHFFDIVRDRLAHARRSPIRFDTTFQAPDHPVTFAEGAYLKAAWVTL